MLEGIYDSIFLVGKFEVKLTIDFENAHFIEARKHLYEATYVWLTRSISDLKPLLSLNPNWLVIKSLASSMKN